MGDRRLLGRRHVGDARMFHCATPAARSSSAAEASAAV